MKVVVNESMGKKASYVAISSGIDAYKVMAIKGEVTERFSMAGAGKSLCGRCCDARSFKIKYT